MFQKAPLASLFFVVVLNIAHSESITETQDPSIICKLPVAVGPCKAAIPRYTYNSAMGECEIFTYGGCGGNGNNFMSPRQCLSLCKGSIGPSRICKLPKAVGPCRAAVPRWKYDHAKGQCELFTWGGCGGNENNFKSEKECINFCKGV